jgi:hypothetical protein
MTFRNLGEVKRANKERGGFWFSKDTLAYFDSHLESKLIGGQYFVTSEQFHGSDGSDPRRFTIREVLNEQAEIGTVGEFQQYTTLQEALDTIDTLVKERS